MTRYTPQWLQAGSFAASVDRRLIGALWPGPASIGCSVQATSGMQASITAGQVAVPTQNNTGSTLCSSDAVETVTLAAAPPSGQNRYDLVTCHPRGNDLDGGSNTDFIFDVVQGAASASPSIPPVPAGQVALAQIYIVGGSASISAANITDVRPGGLAIAGAGALPPPVTSGTTIQTFTTPDGEVWVAKNGVNGGAWKKARDVIHGRWWRQGAMSIPTTFTRIVLDSTLFDTYGLLTAGSARVPIAGHYQVNASIGLANTAANQLSSVAIYVSGSWKTNANSYSSAATQFWDVPTSDIVNCVAGDTIELWARSTGINLGASQQETFLAIAYLGTG